MPKLHELALLNVEEWQKDFEVQLDCFAPHTKPNHPGEKLSLAAYICDLIQLSCFCTIDEL